MKVLTKQDSLNNAELHLFEAMKELTGIHNSTDDEEKNKLLAIGQDIYNAYLKILFMKNKGN